MKHQKDVKKNTILVSASSIRAVCWFYKRKDVLLLNQRGEVSYGLDQPDSKHRLLDTKAFKLLVDKYKDKKEIALILSSRKYKKIQNALPEPFYIDSNGKYGYVFLKY